MRAKEPLFRKVNTRTRGVHHLRGPDFAWVRNSKAEGRAEAEGVTRGKMVQGVARGLDYTPLYRFLLSKVGQDWPAVDAEARSRLDRPDAIFRMVALRQEDGERLFRSGETSYFSGLFVDGGSRLALGDPTLTEDDLEPGCPCCTYTLNGKTFTQACNADRPGIQTIYFRT